MDRMNIIQALQCVNDGNNLKWKDFTTGEVKTLKDWTDSYMMDLKDNNGNNGNNGNNSSNGNIYDVALTNGNRWLILKLYDDSNINANINKFPIIWIGDIKFNIVMYSLNNMESYINGSGMGSMGSMGNNDNIERIERVDING